MPSSGNKMSKNWLETSVELIKEDRVYYKNNEWPLVPLSEVNKITTETDDSMFKIDKRCKINSVAMNPFDEIIDKLFKVPGVSDCMVIAGGYLHELILHHADKRKWGLVQNYMRSDIDIDCFFYGKPEKDIISVFNAVTEFLRLEKKFKVIESRNQYVYNFELHDSNSDEKYMFQFILKIFDNKSSIIGQFDLNASSILYDGNDVQFTPLSAYSYATKYNYIDTTRASPTYEYRLYKYCCVKNGFGIAFPEFDNSKKSSLKTHNNLTIAAFINNKYTTKLNPKYTKLEYLYSKCKYHQKNDPTVDEYNTYGDFVNVSKLIDLYYKNKLNKVYFHIKNDICMIDTKEIRNFYHNKIPTFYRGSIYNLRYFYDEKTFKNMIETILFFKQDKLEEIRDNFVKKIIGDVLLYIDENYNSKEKKINFFTEKSVENPLNPMPIDPKVWYGEYYKNDVL